MTIVELQALSDKEFAKCVPDIQSLQMRRVIQANLDRFSMIVNTIAQTLSDRYATA